MRVRFEDVDLERVYVRPESGQARLGVDLVRSFRKKVGIIGASVSEVDLRSMRSLNFEKLSGDRDGQHSLRLNQQWRLIVELVADDQGTLVKIIEIVDYH